MSSGRTTYSEFKKKLARLAESLLPSDSATGKYTDSQKDRIHAYVVLAHAEIEDFLEGLARYIVDRARRNSSPPQCASVISRLIFHKNSRGNDKIDSVTTDSISGAVTYYENIVAGNNGIRSENLFKMFMPLGLTHDDFDPILMQNLNTFASYRGGIAHTSARLQQGSSPSAERSKIEAIANELSHLDQKIRGLLNL
jgi:hypothetical protein